MHCYLALQIEIRSEICSEIKFIAYRKILGILCPSVPIILILYGYWLSRSSHNVIFGIENQLAARANSPEEMLHIQILVSTTLCYWVKCACCLFYQDYASNYNTLYCYPNLKTLRYNKI